MTTSTPWMPVFSERAAPTFDRTHPNHLPRFFAQLETLFDRCNVQSDLEKKTYVTAYAEPELAKCWEALPQFYKASHTYFDFRACLLDFYHQGSFKYIALDLDRVINERLHIGYHSLHDLSEFHLQFNAIASFLVSVDLLSPREQSQAYLRAFDAEVSSRISIRLQIDLQDHSPSRPYTVDEIFKAAEWILLEILTQSSSSTSILPYCSTPSQIEPLEVPETSETSKMLDIMYSMSPSDVPSHCPSTSPSDIEIASQEALDDRIAELEAEIGALRAENEH